MRKTCFVFMIIGVLLFTAACDSQSEPTPTINICTFSRIFSTEKELNLFMQDSDKYGNWMDLEAYLPCSRLFPGDIMRDASMLHKNYLLGSVYITEDGAYMMYETDYDPSYSNASLSDRIGGPVFNCVTAFTSFEDITVTKREENISELNNTLRYNLVEPLSSQIFVLCGAPIAYNYKEGELVSVLILYKNFLLKFYCTCFNNHLKTTLDWDADSDISYINMLKNLTDPDKAEQEMRRLQSVIDKNLENS